MSRIRRAHLSVSGPDRKGTVARFATLLFKQGVNIEDIAQRVDGRLFRMSLTFDLTEFTGSLDGLEEKLTTLGHELEMKVRVRLQLENAPKRIAVLVTKEPHALEQLLHDHESRRYPGAVVAVVGNRNGHEERCRRSGVPFYFVPSDHRPGSESQILAILKRHDVDLVVLARYMQILSPAFVFLYEGRIINIHPSLLPAFPGPRAYTQAYNAGAGIAGVTAHFVTSDLDHGPIIDQEEFRIDKISDKLCDVVERGRLLEARVLSRAVRLYCADRLAVRRGKVIWKPETVQGQP